MAEHPILICPEMVPAVRDDSKTQTRRVIRCRKDVVSWSIEEREDGTPWPGYEDRGGDWQWITCPYGGPGDTLWVRETWSTHYCMAEEDGIQGDVPFYRTDYDGDPVEVRWRPSIHMPRWASRITLEVEEVRVQRVQEITPADCEAEGLQFTSHPNLSQGQFRRILADFEKLWDSINAKRGVCKTCKGFQQIPGWAGSVAGNSLMQTAEDCPDCDGPSGYGWDVNPWVWAVTFKRKDDG